MPGMCAHWGVVRYDDCILRNEYGVGTEFECLWTGASGFSDRNGGKETYRFELARVSQVASTQNAQCSLNTTAKHRGRYGKAAS